MPHRESNFRRKCHRLVSFARLAHTDLPYLVCMHAHLDVEARTHITAAVHLGSQGVQRDCSSSRILTFHGLSMGAGVWSVSNSSIEMSGMTTLHEGVCGFLTALKLWPGIAGHAIAGMYAFVVVCACSG